MITSSANPSVVGDPVTFTATMNPAAQNQDSSSYFIANDTTYLATITDGVASATIAAADLPEGTDNVGVVLRYTGLPGDNSGEADAGYAQVVNAPPVLTPTTTALASSTNPSTAGQPVTFTATVTPSTATGTVNFVEGTTVLGSGTLSGGHATFTTSSLSAATHCIKAVYLGNASYATSPSAQINQVVHPAPITTTTALASSANPSNSGQPVTFTATVSTHHGDRHRQLRRGHHRPGIGNPQRWSRDLHHQLPQRRNALHQGRLPGQCLLRDKSINADQPGRQPADHHNDSVCGKQSVFRSRHHPRQGGGQRHCTVVNARHADPGARHEQHQLR